jgi:hypothetical protein
VHALQKAQTSSVVHSFFIWLSYPDDDSPYGARLMLFFLRVEKQIEGRSRMMQRRVSGNLTAKATASPSIISCSLGLSATSQQYFSLRTNQPPATSHNQPAVLFSQNKPAPAISYQPTDKMKL